MQLYLGVAKK